LSTLKEQMGYGSILVTVDTYGHLIPGAKVAFVGPVRPGPCREVERKLAAIRNPHATKRN